MAQQIILADQLVPKFQGIRRCNNYVMLQSISCSPECKIVGQILLDHLLSYALTATTDVPAGKKRKQNARDTSLPQKSLKVTIKQKHVVKGEKDVKSYANKFVASMIHDDVDDSRDRIDPTSHKEHSKVVVDDDDNKKEKKYEKEGDEMGSWETRTEKMQTSIPTTPRSPRINLYSDKNIPQELKDTVYSQPPPLDI
ncbi:hypothetical protein Tco_0848396 [Tanacetum coccineum]